MAAAYYNHLTGTSDADAAGTEVEISGEKLGDRRNRRGGTRVIEVMLDEGIDLTNKEQTQLEENMLNQYDQVISMADHQYTPSWLRKHPRFIYWEVKDPGGKDIAAAKIARGIVKQKVEALIKELGSKD